MIETPQWLSFTVTIMSVSFIMAYEDLSLQCQLLLFPHLLHSCGSGHILFIDQKNFVPLPQSLCTCYSHAAIFLSIPSFHRFNHFHPSSSITSSASTTSKVATFLHPSLLFHISTCKMIIFISSFTAFFLTICKFRESLFILRTSICLFSLTVSGMQ